MAVRTTLLMTSWLLAASGCEMLAQQSSEPVEQPLSATEAKPDYAAMLLAAQQDQTLELSTSRQFTPYQHHKSLVNYVEQMALELSDTMVQENELGIAVTSFVEFDANLDNSSQLGNQIAESMLYQLQKFGYGVVDFKAQDIIEVTSRGDFVLSRDAEQLAERRIASHVLAGTLINRPNGVEVNARVINLNSKQVAASAQKLIPYFVLQSQSIQTTAKIN